MSKIEIFVIVITVVATVLYGLKNNWAWAFAIASNVIWFIIGLRRGVAAVMVSSAIYFILSLWGAYSWLRS